MYVGSTDVRVAGSSLSVPSALTATSSPRIECHLESGWKGKNGGRCRATCSYSRLPNNFPVPQARYFGNPTFPFPPFLKKLNNWIADNQLSWLEVNLQVGTTSAILLTNTKFCDLVLGRGRYFLPFVKELLNGILFDWLFRC